MSSFLPLTGTTITMGRVRNAFNLAGTASLNGTLGPRRTNRRATDDADIGDAVPGSTSTGLSASFGGRRGPGTY